MNVSVFGECDEIDEFDCALRSAARAAMESYIAAVTARCAASEFKHDASTEEDDVRARMQAAFSQTEFKPAGAPTALALALRTDLAAGRLTMAEYAREARSAGLSTSEVSATLKQHAAAKDASFMEASAEAATATPYPEEVITFPAGTYYGRLHATAVKVVDGIFVPVIPAASHAISEELSASLQWLREQRPWGARAAERLSPENNFLPDLELHDESRGGRVAGGKVDPEGAMHIACALRLNTVLTSLNLGDNCLGDEGAAHLATALASNRTLTELNLAGNGLSDAGADLLAAMLETNRVLATIDIGGNALSDAAMARLREVWGARDAKNLRFDF